MLPSLLATNPRAYRRRPTSTMSALSCSREASGVTRNHRRCQACWHSDEQNQAVSPPLEIPSGWHMLGQTAVRTYDPARKSESFLFEPGDYLRFHAVTPQKYRRQLEAAETGDLVAEREDFRE